MLDKIKLTGLSPRWVLVPDVVTDRDATLRNWEKYAPLAARYEWPLAIAVQDGMTPADLPDNAVVFVGGSTDWKWNSLKMWTETGRRIHVGRVNEEHRLEQCEALGVESVDGTGWMRGTEDGRQARGLKRWLASHEKERRMRTIIAGPRHLTDPWLLDAALKACPWTGEITSVVCGMARGIDSLGKMWADYHNLPVDEHPVTDADWLEFGRAAGHLRNAQMANVAEAVLAVWDGKSKGTGGMIQLAKRMKLRLFVHRV